VYRARPNPSFSACFSERPPPPGGGGALTRGVITGDPAFRFSAITGGEHCLPLLRPRRGGKGGEAYKRDKLASKETEGDQRPLYYVGLAPLTEAKGAFSLNRG
jgi:hypothetical protein